jgi:hypothetical protein
MQYAVLSREVCEGWKTSVAEKFRSPALSRGRKAAYLVTHVREPAATASRVRVDDAVDQVLIVQGFDTNALRFAYRTYTRNNLQKLLVLGTTNLLGIFARHGLKSDGAAGAANAKHWQIGRNHRGDLRVAAGGLRIGH